MQLPKAIIFDFDGVVADTMQDNFLAWKVAFSKFDIDIDAHEYFLLEGMGRFQIAEQLCKNHSIPAGKEQDLVEAKEAIYHAMNRFRLFPETEHLLAYLKSLGLKMALVTGASRHRIEKTLPAEIRPYFDAVVTVDDVTNGKPDPEPFQKAISFLGLNPDQCWVIENARLGIQSAKAAGTYCVALETTLSKEFLEEADEVFPHHQGLLTHFSQLFENKKVPS